GTLTSNGSTTFVVQNSNSPVFAVTLNGSGVGSSTRLVETVGGSVNLTNATLSVTQSTPTATGQVFTIVSSSPGGVTGTFNGLANNATFINGGHTFQITYTTSAVTLTDVT